MNALAIQIALALIRHGLVAVGLERVAHDPEITTKIVAGLFSLGGLIWSFARKSQRQSKQIEVKPIPHVPAAKS